MGPEVTIAPHWRRCLELALEAYAAGSLAIASVICSEAGTIIAEGRNGLFDGECCGLPARNSLLAHAELEAIGSLPTAHLSDKRIRLYTTVEPCPMCMGAIVMSPVRWVAAASRDPWAGAFGLLSKDRYLESKNIHVEYERGLVEEACFYLHLASHRRRSPGIHPFFDAMERAYPTYFATLSRFEGSPGIQAALAAQDVAGLLHETRRLRA